MTTPDPKQLAAQVRAVTRATNRVAGSLTRSWSGGTPTAATELGRVIDEELEHLSDRHRLAFVLCCLEGLTNAEAARELGCPVGTVDSRLHAARTRLRDRLARRGFAPAALAGAVVVVAVPPAVSAAAIAFGVSTRAPSPVVDQLANQIGRTVPHTTIIAACAAVLGLAVAAVAFGAFENAPPPPTAPAPALAPAPRPREVAPALLFTELVLKPGETGSRTVRLTRVNFRDGKLDTRDALHTGDLSEFGSQA